MAYGFGKAYPFKTWRAAMLAALLALEVHDPLSTRAVDKAYGTVKHARED